MSDKESIVKSIAHRIRSEYKKHSSNIVDWEFLAAAKIYDTHFKELNQNKFRKCGCQIGANENGYQQTCSKCYHEFLHA
jgi:hypothetical protein